MRTTIALLAVIGALTLGVLASSGDAAPTLEEIQQLADSQKWSAVVEGSRAFLSETPDDPVAEFFLAYGTHASGDYLGAIPLHEESSRNPQFAPVSLYNLACAHALAGHKTEALDTLQRARASGYGWLHNANPSQRDPDLDSIRADARFKLPRPIEFVEFTGTNGQSCTYALHLPDDFDPEQPAPVIVGMGPGSESQGAAEWGLRAVWGEQAITRGWAVVAASRPHTGWTSDQGKQLMAELLDHVETRVSVEGGKFHIAGCSNGGRSAFALAIHMPERFHSISVIPGTPPRARQADLERLEGLAVRMHVGDGDTPWLESNQMIIGPLQDFGIDATLTVYENEGHVIGAIQGPVFMTGLDELHAAIMQRSD